MQEGTRHMRLRPSINLELYRIFQCFPRLPSEIRVMIWNHAMIFWSEPRVICKKLEPSKPGVPIPIGHTAMQCPLLQVNQEARTETLNVVQPYICSNYGFPVVYINFRLDTILFDGYKSFDQFCKRVERPGWREVDVPHIALSQATWTKLHNPLLVEDGDMDPEKFLKCMACIWFLGVRDITILVTGKEDPYHRSAIKFETPKESPFKSGLTMNESLEDWESLEQEIAEEIEGYKSYRVEHLVEPREGCVSESEIQDQHYYVDWLCGEGWVPPTIRFMVASVKDANV